MKKTLTLLSLILFFACADKRANSKLLNIEPKKNDIEIINFTSIGSEKEENLKKVSIDSLWNIITQKSSCLTGGQYETNGEFRSEGCVMEETKEWEILFEKPKKILTEFLLTKLEKTETTSVHTCPFFLATEGELATYALQRIYVKNWFDFEEFKHFKERAEKPQEPPTSNRDNYQIWLQEEVLQNPKNREILKKLWLAEMNK